MARKTTMTVLGIRMHSKAVNQLNLRAKRNGQAVSAYLRGVLDDHLSRAEQDDLYKEILARLARIEQKMEV